MGPKSTGGHSYGWKEQHGKQIITSVNIDILEVLNSCSVQTVWEDVLSDSHLCCLLLISFFTVLDFRHFRPCWLSWCLRRSTFLWKPLEQISQPKGLKPVCLRLCVMRLELWLNALPHTWHLCGFSPVQVSETQNVTDYKKQDFCFTCTDLSILFNRLPKKKKPPNKNWIKIFV